MATIRKKTVAPAQGAAKRTASAAPAKTVRAAKPVDPALQASKQALADALAAAKAVKIEKPLTPPVKKTKPAAVKTEKEAKEEKPRKIKLVRDRFTMPENEYARIAALKKCLLAQGVTVKKSQILRAGVALLAGLADDELAAALRKIEGVKSGK